MEPSYRGSSESRFSQAQRERLAYLELRLYFFGELQRADLEARFGIAPAAATRDLNSYRALAPQNLSYDSSQKAYVPSAQFKPLFQFSPERILAWLLQGFGDGLDLRIRKAIPCEGPSQLIAPDLQVLAILTRAILNKRPVQVTYLSLSSGPSKRVIVPVALADNGLRWHVRAYDRNRNRFSDFVLTRITKAKSLDEKSDDTEQFGADAQWVRLVDLEIVPHPGIAFPEAIVADYGMRDGLLRLQMRAALVGYALNRWNVDCSPNHSLDSSRHHLWLRNQETLYGVESASLALGREKQ